jgi:anaerobic magnesium-protoporphyrin IX monomethyl ester cyclase
MVDMLFIVPPFSYKGLEDASSRCPNLGMAILAAILEKKGYAVKILDAFSLSLNNQQIIEYVKKVNPKIIGISSVTANFGQAMDILEAIKATDQQIITIYGGPHVTIMPDSVLKSKNVDYIVLGEAEKTIVELIGHLLHKKGDLENIKGIGYKDNEGKIKLTSGRDFIKDIDDIPMPAYHLLPMDSYRAYGWLDLGRKFCSMITSRGCPFQCTYCTSSKIFGYRWRYRSVENVFKEIMLLYNKYGIRHIYFQDDEFTVNHQRVLDICNKIIENKLDLVWECLTRVSHVDEELLKKMGEAGCKSILYGIECGYQEGIDKINKKITLEQAIDAVRLSKKYGISPKVTFMMGFPWEGKEEIKKTISFAKKLNGDLTFFNVLNPYPGTPLYDQIKKDNLFVGGYSWDRYSPHGETPVIRTKHLTENELAYWNGRAYLAVYSSPRFILRKLKMLTNIRELRRNFKSAISLFSTYLKRTVTKK